MSPCDTTKGLQCQPLGKHGEDICEPKPGGKTCFVQGREFANGDEFNPTNSCTYTCICVNGDIGCFQTCPKKPPSGCVNARLCRRKKDECCGVWTCGENKNRQCEKGYEQEDSGPFSAAYKPADIVATIRKTDNCYVQTTAWSPCSRVCDWGIRERVSNNNTECDMKKETKLCKIKPCGSQQENELDSLLESSKYKNKMCAKTLKQSQPIKYTFSGCETVQKYRPRYCGKCKDEKCCSPDHTETILVDFVCQKDGATFQKKMDNIRNCTCDNQCFRSIDIFSSVKLLRDDLHH